MTPRSKQANPEYKLFYKTTDPVFTEETGRNRRLKRHNNQIRYVILPESWLGQRKCKNNFLILGTVIMNLKVDNMEKVTVNCVGRDNDIRVFRKIFIVYRGILMCVEC